MKTLSLTLLLVATSAFAQYQGADIAAQGNGTSISVRGMGPVVCGAGDVFHHIPQLGRGYTDAEAIANARYLVGKMSTYSDGFIENYGCERTDYGTGQIFISGDEGSTQIRVDEPAYVQCIAHNPMANRGTFSHIATAGTRIEASSLSLNSCKSIDSSGSMFCTVECENLVQAPQPPRYPAPPVHRGTTIRIPSWGVNININR
jgi:hypothetical protein